MATKKKATKKKATKKKGTKKKATKRKATKKKATKKATKKKATKRKATKKKGNPKKGNPKKANPKKANPPGIVADFNHGGRRIVLQEYSNGYLSAWLVPKGEPADTSNRLPVSSPNRTKDPGKMRHQAKDWVDHVNAAQKAAADGKQPPPFSPTPYRNPKPDGRSDQKNGTSLREREVAKWLRGGRLKY